GISGARRPFPTRRSSDLDEDQAIRSVLGRLLFSADDIVKDVPVLSGGEKNRMTFGRLMLGRHNVLLMDEPTNHLDMESIESLQRSEEHTSELQSREKLVC